MWQADLEDAASFLAPIKGCKYVIHTASPVVMNPPKGKVSFPSQHKPPLCTQVARNLTTRLLHFLLL